MNLKKIIHNALIEHLNENNEINKSNNLEKLYNDILLELTKESKINNNFIQYTDGSVFILDILGYGVIHLNFMNDIKTMGFGLTTRTKKPFISVPRSNELDFVENFKEYEDGVKHELSHFLDYNRKKILFNTTNKYDRNKKEYFNDSSEINAYVSQGINKLINSLNKNFIRYKPILDNFDLFKDELIDSINVLDDIVSYFDDESKKRFNKRIYSLWIELKQKYN